MINAIATEARGFISWATIGGEHRHLRDRSADSWSFGHLHEDGDDRDVVSAAASAEDQTFTNVERRLQQLNKAE
jgi:hypothetical protein